MKTPTLPKYLYLRNKSFYFRFRFKRIDLRISMFTSDLQEAHSLLLKISFLSERLEALKKLESKVKSDILKSEVAKIRMFMKKVFKMEHVESVIRKYEEDYAETSAFMSQIQPPDFRDINLDEWRALREIAVRYLSNEISEEEYSQELLAGSHPNGLKLFLSFLQGSFLREANYSFKDIQTNRYLNKTTKNLCTLEHFLPDFTEQDEDDISMFERFKGAASEILDEQGYEYCIDSVLFRYFTHEVSKSSEIFSKLVSANLMGDGLLERQIKSALPTPEIKIDSRESEAGPLFSEVYEEFLAFKKQNNLSDKIQKEYAGYFEVWNLLVPDKPIEQYSNRDIGRFIDRCFFLPKRNKSPFNKMTIQECVKCDDVPDDCLVQPKTVKGYYKWLQGVFAYAKSDNVGYIELTPCTIKKEFTQRRRGPFSGEEMKTLLRFALEERESWKKWVLLLGIYTGARRGEIYQLRKEDLKQEGSIFYLLITDNHESQKLKTKNSKRRIPVHEKLIEYGFIEFVNGRESRLFEELTNVEVITAWFSRALESLNIESMSELDELRSFHSLRHTFISYVRNNANFDVALLQQVVGHEISKAGITDNYTHNTASVKRLAEVVNCYVVE